MNRSTSIVAQRQAPLRETYDADPRRALILKYASTAAGPGQDPLHGIVIPGRDYGTSVRFGIDRAVGGMHDAPNPAELLCTALAACEDTTLRMIADVLGIRLKRVDVEVTGDVDVRGAMSVDRKVPVGFRSMACAVRIETEAGTPARMIDALVEEAERSCIVLQTLRCGVATQVGFTVDGHAPSGGRNQVAGNGSPGTEVAS